MAKTKETLLIIDDDPIHQIALTNILEDDYEFVQAYDGQEGLQMYLNYREDISLVLLDFVMPDMNGFQAMELLKSKPQFNTPVIFVTSKSDENFEAMCFNLGAVDFIQKPIYPKVIKSRIAAQISHRKIKNELRTQVREAIREQKKIVESIVIGLANLLEHRSVESGSHLKRVKAATELLTRELQITTSLLDDYKFEDLENIAYAALLHDIGKIGVIDDILHKPGTFELSEYEKMKQHTIIGCEIAKSFYMGDNSAFIETCMDVIRGHHEKYDGSGYPDGLAGNDIPIAARIIGIIDTYDALVNDRVYKDALEAEKAFEIMYNESGTSFDPILVKAMLGIKNDILALYQEEKALKTPKQYIMTVNKKKFF